MWFMCLPTERTPMYGYLVADESALDGAERRRYQELYCGLCHALGARYDLPSKLGLSYDMVFLVMLLGSLYEPAEDTGSARCPVHPLKEHTWCRSVCTDFAADISVALSYHKLLDNWVDDRSVSARAGVAALRRSYGTARLRAPRACDAIERELARLSELERAQSARIDEAAACFGRALGEIFAWREDFWAPQLRAFGAHLGGLVYLMDAACDYGRDRKRESYNPFIASGIDPGGARDAIESVAGAAADAFERLPLERDLHLMRNVIYAGIWAPYNRCYGNPSAEGDA